MRVGFRQPRGGAAFYKVLDIPAVPRIGEEVYLRNDDNTNADNWSGVVKNVIWHPDAVGNTPEADVILQTTG